MIGSIALWLIARNPAMTLSYARRLAKMGLIAVAVVLAVAGLFLWDWLDDRAAIKAHEAERVEQALEATTEANSNDVGRRAAAEAQSDSTQAELEAIRSADPQSTSRPAPAGARAVANRLPKGN